MPPVRGKKGFVKKSTLEKYQKVAKAQTERHATKRKVKAVAEMAKEEQEQEGLRVRIGRRVIHMATFATQMWCGVCDNALSIRFLEKEEIRGMACCLYVRCHRCLDLVQVATDSTVKTLTPGPDLYSVNCKAAFGSMDTGIALDQLNKFLSALDVPPIQRNTLDRAKKRVSKAIIDTAKQSCQDAIAEERELTLAAARGQSEPIPEDEANIDDPAPQTPTTPKSRPKRSSASGMQSPQACQLSPEALEDFMSDEEIDLIIQYDFGWNKRGNGHTYDSHSGHGSAIGQFTKKVLAYDAISKYCAMCARGHAASDHDCAINFEGCSKAMEPHCAVKILLKNEQFKENKVRLGTLIGDADSSTMAALSRESARPIKKYLDLNHGLKGFSRALWKLKTQGPFKWLNNNIISNLVNRCLGYALAQHRGDVEGTRQATMNIANHVYGEHASCGDWCKAKDDAHYLYHDFPHKAPLTCPDFKVALTKCLQDMADNAEQLAPGGSTQQNESFNHMVATRAPKSRHYCGTDSNYLRLCATVSYKNLGANHCKSVYKSAELSPSVSAYRDSVQRRSEWKAKYQSRIDVKRRRLFLKKKNHWAEASAEAREGPTYVSGMSTVMERAVAGSEVSNGWLPAPCDLHPECAVVYVDIETTGLSPSAQIVQVAAKCNDQLFSVFMMPTVSFDARASEATGFRVFKGELLYRDEVLSTTPPQSAADQFLQFLETCGPQVLLVGHNIIRFDAPRILKWMKEVGRPKDLCEIAYGFTDTLNLIKQDKMKRQELLAKTYLTGPEWQAHLQGAHNAISDVTLLEGLVQHFEVGLDRLKSSAISVREFFQNQLMAKRKRNMLPQLAELKDLVSEGMRGRMAAHGVTIPDLVREYIKNGELGLTVFLGVRINGKARVTSSKKIIGTISAFIKAKIEEQHRLTIAQRTA